MNYIRITGENIDREHICCAMSGKQSLAKKEWMKRRFDEGLVFYRSEERGKCFIEYIPAENAWVPIDGRRLSLYQLPLGRRFHERTRIFKRPAFRMRPRCRERRKRKASAFSVPGDGSGNFLPIRSFWPTRASRIADRSDCGINLMYLPLACRMPQPPEFRECARASREYRRTALSSTAPISARLRTIGCRGSVRLQRSTESRLKSFTSPTKKLRRTYPRRSRPMPCSGTENS